MEFRSILRPEAEQFLAVLCRVFHLDYSRGKDVFFDEPFFELERKWAAFENGSIVATMTTVPLQFGDGPAVGIAGVATVEEMRGSGVATKLMSACLESCERKGENRALLFAAQTRLYEKLGFKVLDEVILQSLPQGNISQLWATQTEAREIYTNWSKADERRLIRDDRRWEFWRWNLKRPLKTPKGYMCYEFGRVRELLPLFSGVPIVDPAEWFGLRQLAQELEIPLTSERTEMFLMGRGFDYVPRMFMTDQF